MEIKVPGYTFIEDIYRSEKTNVYRAIDGNGKNVIVKCLVKEYPTLDEISNVKKEYEILNKVSSKYIIRLIELIRVENSYALILEDFNGVSLDKIIRNENIPIIDKLRIGLQLTKALESIHSKDIIHKDINPTNILYNNETKQIKIIDFEISQILHENLRPNMSLEGTIEYTSPEQTGRLGKIVDYRSDYYSLGMTLYKLFNKTLPFVSNENSEMIHFHIAKQPISPSKVNSAIPKEVSKIILKLLEKNPDLRYQSNYGIRKDLLEIINSFRKKENLNNFVVGKNDIVNRYIFNPEILIREKYIQILKNKIENIKKEKADFWLLSGEQGTGKSLINEKIRQIAFKNQVYFIKCKFDENKTNTPLGAIIEGLKLFFEKILTEDKDSIENWKYRILRAVGINGKIITDLIPDLKEIIGEPNEIDKLHGKEAINRFNLTFFNFITSLSTREKPVIIYLDDLHWADYNSIRFIKDFIKDYTIKHTLMIGTTREKDGKLDDDTLILKNELTKLGIKITHTRLENFSKDEIINIYKRVFNSEICEIEEISEITLQKTHGNPLFLKNFVDSIYEEKIIKFNYRKKQWVWDDRLKEKEFTVNVIDTLLAKIKTLDSDTLEFVKLCACFGKVFRLDIIENIFSNQKDFSTEIRELIDKGFIVNIERSKGSNYKFVHNKIREALLSLLDKQKQKEFSLKIARSIKSVFSNEEIENSIFDLASFYSYSIDLIKDKDEIEEVLKINIKAAEKAEQSGAYRIAITFLKKSIELMPQSYWEERYNIAYKLYKTTLEISYLQGEFNFAKQIEDTAFTKTKFLLEKIDIYENKITALTTLDKLDEAVEMGLEALKLLNFKMKKNPNSIELFYDLISVKHKLKKIEKIEDIKNKRVLNDKYKLAIVRILVAMGGAGFYNNPKLLFHSTLKVLKISLKYGHSIYNDLGYITLGIFLCSRVNSIELGYKISKSALELAEKESPKEFLVKGNHLFYSLISFWKANLRDDFPRLKDNFEMSLEIGDMEYAGYSIIRYFRDLFFTANDFKEVSDDLLITRNKVFSIKNKRIQLESDMILQTALNLQNPEKDENINGEYFDEKTVYEYEKRYVQLTSGFALFKLMLLHFFNIEKDIDKYINLAEKHKLGFGTGYSLYLYEFYLGLSLLAQNKKADKIIKKYEKYARSGSKNFINKLYLLKAERARLKQKSEVAKEYYELAIKESNKNGFYIEEIIASERAAEYYFLKNYDRIGKSYIRHCYYLAKKIKAEAKAKQLEKKYEQTFRGMKTEESTLNTTVHSTITSTVSDRIDNDTIIKSTQILSGEIVLENLLKELINLIFENAGAEKVVLLLDYEDGIYIEADGDVSEENINSNLHINLNNYKSIPKTIINYVYRFQKTVVIEDAENEERFLHDTYILKNQTKSVLCIPIKNKSSLTGMIYLENNLLKGAFSRERIKFLEIFTNQISISLENAKLYSKLENSEEKYKTLVNNIQEGVFILKNKKIVYGNQAFFNIIGTVEEKALGKNFLTFISQKHSLEMADFYNRRINSNESNKEIEIEIKQENGKTVPVIINSELISYEGQKAIEGTIKDITQRKVSEEVEKKYRNHLEELVQERAKEVKNLLDHAGQGFLSFGEDLIIKPEYSLECENIFKKDLDGKNVVSTIFYNQNREEKKFLPSLFKRVLEFKEEKRRKTYLDLLPKEIKNENKYINLEYKVLEQNRKTEIMIIATDVTERKSLEEKMEEERNNLKLVVKAVTDTDGILRSIQDYKEYFTNRIYTEISSSNDIKQVLTTIYRRIHTYKGDLAQWNMNLITLKLNEVETELSEMIKNIKDITKDDIIDFIKNYNFLKWIENEKEIIKNRIGKDIFNQEEKLLIDKKDIMAIEDLILSEFYSHEYSSILPKVRKLRYANLKDMLLGYQNYVDDLSERLGKKINQIKIYGEDIFLDKEIYYSFIKSLIHIFRNILDHGIETVEERVELGKTEEGNITIEIDDLSEEILISIKDDGKGIDIEKVKEKIISQNIFTNEELKLKNKEDILQIIFMDQFSTKETSDDVSGRGVGLSAVRSSTEELSGKISIETEQNKGTEFLFKIPFIENTKEEKVVSQKVLLNVIGKKFYELVKNEYNISILDTENFESEVPFVEVDDITALINIRGMISAKAIISLNNRIAKDLMNKAVLSEVSKEEEEVFIEATIAEILNIIIGNSTEELFENDILVNFDPPMLFYGKKGSVSSSGNCVFGERYNTKKGEITLGLLI